MVQTTVTLLLLGMAAPRTAQVLSAKILCQAFSVVRTRFGVGVADSLAAETDAGAAAAMDAGGVESAKGGLQVAAEVAEAVEGKADVASGVQEV